MSPPRSQLDVEAQGDPEERRGAEADKILERIDNLGPKSPEGRAYDQLKTLTGEGSLLDALQKMVRQVRMAESRLAADKDQKKENRSAISKLRWFTSLFERREKRAIADARVYASMDFTFPVGFIRELKDAIAYFEGDNERSARQVLGLGKRSGGGAKPRSKLSIRHAAVGRCAEEVQGAFGENCNEPIGILAATLFDLKDATATNVERWRKQWAQAVGLDAHIAAEREPEE